MTSFMLLFDVFYLYISLFLSDFGLCHVTVSCNALWVPLLSFSLFLHALPPVPLLRSPRAQTPRPAQSRRLTVGIPAAYPPLTRHALLTIMLLLCVLMSFKPSPKLNCHSYCVYACVCLCLRPVGASHSIQC